jgi:hypothetical protein
LERVIFYKLLHYSRYKILYGCRKLLLNGLPQVKSLRGGESNIVDREIRVSVVPQKPVDPEVLLIFVLIISAVRSELCVVKTIKNLLVLEYLISIINFLLHFIGYLIKIILSDATE